MSEHGELEEHILRCGECMAREILLNMRELGVHPEIIIDALKIALASMKEAKEIFETITEPGGLH